MHAGVALLCTCNASFHVVSALFIIAKMKRTRCLIIHRRSRIAGSATGTGRNPAHWRVAERKHLPSQDRKHVTTDQICFS
jgi:hypothetical protein